MKRSFTMFLTAIIFMSLCAALPAAAGTITITGSTTVLPIAEKIAEVYMRQHPDTVISISGGGSGNGIKAIIDGTTDIGNASRFIKEKELSYANGKGIYPVPFRVAYDCIVPIVHPSNRINDLTITQLREIYKGKIKNWRDVGGVDSPIHVVSRDTSSGTYEVWESKVMKKEEVFPGVQLADSNEEVLKAVMADRNAIGYIGLGYMEDSVKAVAVDKIRGSEATTLNGSYPVSRPLFMFTKGWPSGETLNFLNYVLEPGLGQVHVKKAGFVGLYHGGGSAGAESVSMSSPNSLESPETLKLLQRYLNALNFDAGPVDGIKGDRTISAMMAFQSKNNLPLEWTVSDAMMKELLRQYSAVAE